MVEHPNQSQPNPGPRAHGTPCISGLLSPQASYRRVLDNPVFLQVASVQTESDSEPEAKVNKIDSTIRHLWSESECCESVNVTIPQDLQISIFLVKLIPAGDLDLYKVIWSIDLDLIKVILSRDLDLIKVILSSYLDQLKWSKEVRSDHDLIKVISELVILLILLLMWTTRLDHVRHLVPRAVGDVKDADWAEDDAGLVHAPGHHHAARGHHGARVLGARQPRPARRSHKWWEM